MEIRLFVVVLILSMPMSAAYADQPKAPGFWGPIQITRYLAVMPNTSLNMVESTGKTQNLSLKAKIGLTS